MVSTRRDFLNSLSAVIGSSFLLTDNILAKTIGREKINDPETYFRNLKEMATGGFGACQWLEIFTCKCYVSRSA